MLIEKSKYIYIGTYEKYERKQDNKIVTRTTVHIQCPYCNNKYDVRLSDFIHKNYGCVRCKDGKYIFKQIDGYNFKIVQEHKNEVEKKKYYYIGTYIKNEMTIDNNIKVSSKRSYIRVRCNYCDKEYDVRFDGFKSGKMCNYCCNRYEDSFAYYIQQNLKKGLNEYWDWEKNECNPYLINKSRNAKSKFGENRKVWIKCNNPEKKDYHGSYQVSCDKFIRGDRCYYCTNRHGQVHPKDSFAKYHLDNTDVNFIENYWSCKNNLNPYNLAPNYTGKIFIKCANDKTHEDYEVTCNNFTYGRRCPICKESKGERRIRKYLVKNNILFTTQKIYSGLFGIGNKNLSYDFYLKDYNLLIEYQGEYHDGTASNQTDKEYKIQKEHDLRKYKYAQKNNINLLEIWYWDYDNIESILNDTLIK